MNWLSYESQQTSIELIKSYCNSIKWNSRKSCSENESYSKLSVIQIWQSDSIILKDQNAFALDKKQLDWLLLVWLSTILKWSFRFKLIRTLITSMRMVCSSLIWILNEASCFSLSQFKTNQSTFTNPTLTLLISNLTSILIKLSQKVHFK